LNRRRSYPPERAICRRRNGGDAEWSHGQTPQTIRNKQNKEEHTVGAVLPFYFAGMDDAGPMGRRFCRQTVKSRPVSIEY
jgi:hypothetical protein